MLKMAAAALAALSLALPARAAIPTQEWELVNPAGEIQRASVAPAKRISTLDGKTIALRWNGKHNGNVFLDRVAELLTQKAPTAKVIKTYEIDPSLNAISGNVNESKRIADALKAMRPDIVIASQCD